MRWVRKRMLLQRLGGSESLRRRRLGHPCISWYICPDGWDRDCIPYGIGAEGNIGSVPGELWQDIVYLCTILGPRSQWGTREEQRYHWPVSLSPFLCSSVWSSLGHQGKVQWQSGVSRGEAWWSSTYGYRWSTPREWRRDRGQIHNGYCSGSWTACNFWRFRMNI